MYVGSHRVWEYPPGLMAERIKASGGESAANSMAAEPSLVALRHPVHDRVNLVLANGVVLRVEWPLEFSSPLVCDCISALTFVLPPAILFAFRAAVLSSEDSSAADSDPEWDAFVAVLEHAVQGAANGPAHSGRFTESLSHGYPPAVTEGQEFPKKSKSDGSKKLKHDDPMGDIAHSADGEAAWLRLLNSDLHAKMKTAPCLRNIVDPTTLQPDVTAAASHAAPVMPPLEQEHLPGMMLALHMIYEDYKLAMNNMQLGASLAALLSSLASVVGYHSYLDLYLRDHPPLSTKIGSDSQTLHHRQSEVCAPPDIRRWLASQLQGGASGEPEMYCPDMLASSLHSEDVPWKMSLKITRLYSLLMSQDSCTHYVKPEPCRPHQSWDNISQNSPKDSGTVLVLPAAAPCLDSGANFEVSDETNRAAVVMRAMLQEGLCMDDLIQMPVGVAMPLWSAILHCRQAPELTWSPEAFRLIGRNELAAQHEMKVDHTQVLFQHVPPFAIENDTGVQDEQNANQEQANDQGKDADGLGMFEQYAALRFGQDRRAKEVHRMLCSSKLMCLRVPRAPETSDHDYLSQQHVALLLRAQRAMALPVGRGMVTIAFIYALPTERLPIPKLVLSGRVPPTNASISLDAANTPADLTNWPSFHNGVAAGLQLVSSDVARVTRNWIVYNRPESPTFEHAGVLMALGLQGHLSQLAVTDIFRYLSHRHSATTVGVLLGMAAAKRGTMDPNVSKMLVMHIPYLLPPSLPEMEVASVVQMAAVMGVGLLYQGTSHRLMTEVLLTEIGRRPMSDSTLEREGYSLAAGLALGFVNLGKGGKCSGFEDLHIEDKLQRYIDGGVDAMATSIQPPNNTARCCRIMESDMVNVDVTAPGATLALGLMYMKTNNAALGSRLRIPDTHFLLEHVRPDFVLLRVLSHSLVMWDDVQPTEEWLVSQVPPFLQKYHAEPDKSSSEELDHEALRQAHAYILAGGCFAIGLRYAGTAHAGAHELLLKHVQYFALGCRSDASGPKEWTQRDRPALETCLNTAAIALGLVMAGTGDLRALKLLRAQRRRIDPEIMYGNHMAMQMAIGFLFLGGGRFTLNRSNTAIASLVVSLYPRFTVTTTSNRYYLQAFRHFYVMALEPRCLHSIDIDTNLPCFVPVTISTSGADNEIVRGAVAESNTADSVTKVELMTPCLIPDVGVKMLEIICPRYWHRQIRIKPGQQIPQVIYVKRKTGCMPFNIDPTGSKHLASDVQFSDRATDGESAHVIDNTVIRAFTTQLHQSEQPMECTTHVDKMPCLSTSEDQIQLLPAFIVLYQLLLQLEKNQPIQPADCWDLRLLLCYHNSSSNSQIISLQSAAVVNAHLDAFFDRMNFESEGGPLEEYLSSFRFPLSQSEAFASFLAYTGFPTVTMLKEAHKQVTELFSGRATRPSTLMPILCILLPQTSTKALSKIASIWARLLIDQ